MRGGHQILPAFVKRRTTMKQQFNDNYERHTRRDERAILSAYRKHVVRKMPGVKNGYRRNRKG
jgi:ribosomal protein L32E